MDINFVLSAHGVINGNRDKFPPPPIINLKVSSFGESSITLTWTNPIDSDFKGVKIQRKTGEYPTSPIDGETVLNGNSESFIDNDVITGTTYYYRAFTYDFDNNINQDASQKIEVTPSSLPFDYSSSPGSNVGIAGTKQAGYFGTVPSSEFINGADLANAIGLSAGTIMYSTTDWLKFMYKEKIQFIPLKPIRYNLSRNNINDRGAVIGTNVVINGLTYKVRIIHGASVDPFDYYAADKSAIGSEWNDLLLPISIHTSDGSWPSPNLAGNPPDWGVGFTDADLGILPSASGSRTWCFERSSLNTTQYLLRDSSNMHGYTPDYTQAYSGWRPVLELV